MKLRSLDHIAMNVRDVSATIRFYDEVLGMEPREEYPGKWSLHFGNHKISILDMRESYEFTRDAIPGAASFCVISDRPLDDVVSLLEDKGVDVIFGPTVAYGATSRLKSIYIRDPDGNLIEISNPI